METLRLSLEAIESSVTRAGGEPRAVAAAGAAFVLAVAVYVLSGKRQTARVQEHWDEVCRQALQHRDSLQHKVLQNGGGIDEV